MKKVTNKQKEKNILKSQETQKQFHFFTEIWDSLAEKRCWQCGKYLGQEPLSLFFDHLIEKSKRPDLRLEKENIFICCGDCHAKKTNGFPGDKHKLAIQIAEEKFVE